MKYTVTYRVLVDYEVEADSLGEAIDKANELSEADERFGYADPYSADIYDGNGEWVDTEYLQ